MIEDVVDGICTEVDEVVEANVDDQEDSRVSQFLVLPEIKQVRPGNPAEVWYSSEESDEDQEGKDKDVEMKEETSETDQEPPAQL